MILELLFNLIFGVLNFFINLIPTFDLSAFTLGAISGLMELFWTVEFFLPISVLVVGFGVYATLEVTLWSLYALNWVVHRLPVVG